MAFTTPSWANFGKTLYNQGMGISGNTSGTMSISGRPPGGPGAGSGGNSPYIGGTNTVKGGIPQTPFVPNIAPPSSVVSGGNLVQNPFQPAALQSAQAAGAASAGQGQANIGSADMMRALAQQGGAAAGQVLNAGFDPQNALYNRTAQQLQDQVRVGQAARGTTMSPYGAGVENQAMSNFNIDWQNNQLQRQLQALSGFGGASGASGAAATQGGNIGQMGVNQIAAEGALPYQQSQANQANDISNWLSIIGAGQANYPLTWAQQQATNYGGVPTPQNMPAGTTTATFGPTTPYISSSAPQETAPYVPYKGQDFGGQNRLDTWKSMYMPWLL